MMYFLFVCLNRNISICKLFFYFIFVEKQEREQERKDFQYLL